MSDISREMLSNITMSESEAADTMISKYVLDVKMAIDNTIEDFIVRNVQNKIPYSETVTMNANKIADAINRAEKYKWHDLRKNPEDLPDDGEWVMCVHSHHVYDGYYPFYQCDVEGNFGHYEKDLIV